MGSGHRVEPTGSSRLPVVVSGARRPRGGEQLPQQAIDFCQFDRDALGAALNGLPFGIERFQHLDAKPQRLQAFALRLRQKLQHGGLASDRLLK